MLGVLQLDTANVKDPNFKDISTSHQYYGAIAALKQAGIIDGYEDGTFRQGETIQRNHVAKILTNALNLNATNVATLPFNDVRDDYKEAIAALYENEITTGKTATTFDGSSHVTRGQFAAFIARVYTEVKNVAFDTKGMIRIFTADRKVVAEKEAELNNYQFQATFVNLAADDYIAEVTIVGSYK